MCCADVVASRERRRDPVRRGRRGRSRVYCTSRAHGTHAAGSSWAPRAAAYVRSTQAHAVYSKAPGRLASSNVTRYCGFVYRYCRRSQVATGSMWSCPGCTFENHPAIVSCEMCGTQRPGGNAKLGGGRRQERAGGGGRAAGGPVRREATAGRGGGSRGNRGRAGSNSTRQPQPQQKQPHQKQPHQKQPHQKQKQSKQPQRQQQNRSPNQQQPSAVEQSRELHQKRVAALALLGGGASLTDDKKQANSTGKPAKARGHNKGKDIVDECSPEVSSGSRGKKNTQKASKPEPRRASDTVRVPSAKDQHQKRGGAESSKKNKNRNASSPSPKASGVTQQRGKRVQPSTTQWPTAPPLRTDGQVTVLHVAEKPSIAQAIANALCGKKRSEQRNGPTPVHEFTSVPFSIPGSGTPVRCKHRVTSGAFYHTLA